MRVGESGSPGALDCTFQVFPTDFMAWMIYSHLNSQGEHVVQEATTREHQGAGSGQLYEMRLTKQERLGLRPDCWV